MQKKIKIFRIAIDILFFHGYTVLGSNCIPIPGAIGVSDYLMLDGFGSMMSEAQAVPHCAHRALRALSRTLNMVGPAT